MVNDGFIAREQAGAERRLILSYARAERRAGLDALLALDATLGGILRSTRDPMVGQLRLTWWHDALSALDTRPPPAEPVLRALRAEVVPHVRGTTLAAMIQGWEELLDPDPLDDVRLRRFASARGGGLFRAGGVVLDAHAGDPLESAGEGWALVDLAAHIADQTTRNRATALAVEALTPAMAARWSREARPLGAMAHLARMTGRGGGARVARVLLHRLTGR